MLAFSCMPNSPVPTYGQASPVGSYLKANPWNWNQNGDLCVLTITYSAMHAYALPTQKSIYSQVNVNRIGALQPNITEHLQWQFS